jgi:hypothetical protein
MRSPSQQIAGLDDAAVIPTKGSINRKMVVQAVLDLA